VIASTLVQAANEDEATKTLGVLDSGSSNHD
jgi:hypothetical protein